MDNFDELIEGIFGNAQTTPEESSQAISVDTEIPAEANKEEVTFVDFYVEAPIPVEELVVSPDYGDATELIIPDEQPEEVLSAEESLATVNAMLSEPEVLPEVSTEPVVLHVAAGELSEPTEYEKLFEGLEQSVGHKEIPKPMEIEFGNAEEVKECYERFVEAHNSFHETSNKYENMQDVIRLLTDVLSSYKKDAKEFKPNVKSRREELDKAQTEYLNLVEEYKNATALRDNEEEFDKIARTKKWFQGVARANGNVDKIYPHHYQAAKRIAASKQLILGDDMGTGKTLTAIASMDLAKLKKVLIITPPNVSEGFLTEIKTWTDRPVLSIMGVEASERELILDIFKTLTNGILVMNYEAWRKDLSVLQDIIEIGFEGVYVDEAHYMKNSKSLTAQGVSEIVHAHNICPKCGGTVSGEIRGKYRTVEAPNENGEVIEVKGKLTGYYRELIGCGNCQWSGQAILDGKDMRERHYASRSVKVIVPMTGTPILNSPRDLFPLLNLIDPIIFADERDYLNLYCLQDPYTGKWEFQEGGQERLVKEFLRGRFIARTMVDVEIELPHMHNRIVDDRGNHVGSIPTYVKIDEEKYPKQVKIMKQIKKNAQILLDSGESLSITAAIAEITRMRQAATYPAGIKIVRKDDNGKEVVVFSVENDMDESAKADKAVEIIKDAASKGERVVLFSQFTEALNGMHKRLEAAGIRSAVFAGKTNNKVRSEIKRNFDAKFGEEPKWDVVLIQYKSGREGLNFTAARHLILLDKEWNPGCENQAIRRIQRIGQTKETYLWDLQAENTIDQWMQSLIDTKRDMIEGFDTSAREVQQDLFEQLKSLMGKEG